MAELLVVQNPHRRRRRKHRYHRRHNPHRSHRQRHARRHNPHRRRHRRYSNPMSVRGITSQFKPVVKEGFIQAFGALGLDVAWGQINNRLPASIQSNTYLAFAVKCLAALAVGWVGGKVMRGRARDFAIGGVTVAAHDLLKSALQTNMPSVFGTGGTLSLGGYGAYLSGSAPIVGTATFPRTHTIPRTYAGMGAYLSGSSGSADGAGVYVDDCMGFDPWGDGA